MFWLLNLQLYQMELVHDFLLLLDAIICVNLFCLFSAQQLY